MSINYLDILFLIFTFGGFGFAYFYGRNCKVFLWREYISIFALGIFGLSFLYLNEGIKPILIFLTFLIIGPIIEWIGGFTSHKALGRRLWHYDRYTWPGGYTSWLTLPLWGLFGVVFYIILKFFS